jgi:hypothetical protein
VTQHYRGLSILFCISVLTFSIALHSQVDSITGDTGTAQSGALTLSGGLSGALFDSTTTTLTQSFNFIALPLTTTTNGQIIFGNEQTVFHAYGAAITNIFVGGGSGNFTLDFENALNNTGCGAATLGALTTGIGNTAIGQAALASVTSGGPNTAVGYQSGQTLAEGGANVFIGDNSGASLTSANNNTLVGSAAGGTLTEGSNNICIGSAAGTSYNDSESNNIIIGSNGGGGDNNVTRIGQGFTQTACYIDGIWGSTIDFTTGLPVYVDDNGTLGTILSSIQFKKHIEPIGSDSSPILDFYPISFVAKSDKSETKQFGLLAEQVEEKMPELVIKDKNNEPYAVRYNELPVLILNELQKLEARVTELESIVEKTQHIRISNE